MALRAYNRNSYTLIKDRCSHCHDKLTLWGNRSTSKRPKGKVYDRIIVNDSHKVLNCACVIKIPIISQVS